MPDPTDIDQQELNDLGKMKVVRPDPTPAPPAEPPRVADEHWTAKNWGAGRALIECDGEWVALVYGRPGQTGLATAKAIIEAVAARLSRFVGASGSARSRGGAITSRARPGHRSGVRGATHFGAHTSPASCKSCAIDPRSLPMKPPDPTPAPPAEPPRVADDELNDLRRWFGDKNAGRASVRDALNRLRFVEADRDKLAKFKQWVHNYLDGQGVPHHPPGTHGEHGCRIGDRMDWLMERLRGAEQDRNRLLAQLPGGMEHCTILYKKCGKGHGWLTATNWVQHGCPTCERDALRAALARRAGGEEGADDEDDETDD